VPLDVLDGFLRGGARLIQLRDKQASSAARLDLADEAVRRCHGAGARLIVNDFADLAAMSRADGVHVGQDDLPVEAARAVLGPGRVVGVSTHDAAQLAAAAASTADYIAVGPVFETRTKETGYTPRGLDFVREAVASAPGSPIVAIGGVSLERVAEVMAAGAASIAVISGLMADDPAARVAAYLQALRV
jgi:thiamine-phosphate pyrophosphorylase